MKRLIYVFALVAPTGVAEARNEPVRIDYMLPAASVAAAVQQRITRCSGPASVQFSAQAGDPALDAGFEYDVALSARPTPRRLVSLNAESGFLVDRETKVHFSDDFYLKDFNGKSTGQGGPLLVSVIKAGAAIYAMSANPILGVGLAAASSTRLNNLEAFVTVDGLEAPTPPRPRQAYRTQYYLVCTDTVLEDLRLLDARRRDVEALEARVTAGDATPSVQDLLGVRRRQVSEITARLTIGAGADQPLRPRLSPTGAVENVSTRIRPVDISRWFRISSARVPVRAGAPSGVQAKPTVASLLAQRSYPGAHGYQVTVKPDDAIARAFGCDPASPGLAACIAEANATDALPTRDLVYARPIPASVRLYPFQAHCPEAASCPAAKGWAAGDAASGTANVRLPQLSRLFRLRTGGSIIGGRTVGAEFGTMGEPTMIQYNIGSAGKDVAGILDAGVAAAQTARDSEIAATKRRLDELKSARDLQDLIDEVYDKPSS